MCVFFSISSLHFSDNKPRISHWSHMVIIMNNIIIDNEALCDYNRMRHIYMHIKYTKQSFVHPPAYAHDVIYVYGVRGLTLIISAFVLLYLIWINNNAMPRTKQMHPTTMYAMPRNGFLPPR